MIVRSSILHVLAAVLFYAPIFTAGALAQQEFFPFLGESKGDFVNVRAGQSANFERLCQLKKGDEVVVLEKEFSWYKIQLPPTAKSFISKEYVQYLGQNAGGITARQVNIRSGPGIHHTVLGQLDEGEQIFILEDLEEWYRIEPVVGSYGWVADDYLAFKSTDIGDRIVNRPKVEIAKPQNATEWTDSLAGEKIKLEIKEEILDGGPDEDMPSQDPEQNIFDMIEQSAPPKKRAMPAKPEPAYEGVISVTGIVEGFDEGKEDGIPLKIVKDGKTVCYVLGTNHILGRFLGQEVAVDGIVSQKLLSRYGQPVISVVKIRLVL